MRRKSGEILFLAFLVVGGAALRVGLLERSEWMVEGDEAVVGLMARHILDGRLPVFFSGLPHTGAYQAYAAAPLFAAFGMSRWALKLVPLIASLVLIATTYLLARRLLSKRAACVAGLVAAVPPIYVAANTLKALSPYTEVMALGNLLLLLGADLSFGERAAWRRALALGVLGGFAFWMQPIVAYYLGAVGLLLALRLRLGLVRLLPASLAGFALGATPLWIGNLGNGFETFRFVLSGNAAPPDTGEVAAILVRTTLPRVLGFNQPWGETPSVAAWALGAVLAAGLLVLAVWGRRTHGWGLAPADLPLLYFLVAAGVFLASGFGGTALNPMGFDSTGRYVLPFWSAVPLAVGALADRLSRVHLSLAAVVALVVAAHLQGWVASDGAKLFQSPYWDRLPPRSDAVRAYLGRTGIRYVWMNHWAGAPLTFDAGETILAADYYDVHVGGGIDRFPEYTVAVERADRAAYVLVTEEAEPPLESRLQELEVAFSKERIGPYLVYRPLSRTVHPREVVEAIDYRY